MWKYKGEEMQVEGITGIPARDMTDEEFKEAEAKMALSFGQLKTLENSGLWEHVSDRTYRSITETKETVKEEAPKQETSKEEKPSSTKEDKKDGDE